MNLQVVLTPSEGKRLIAKGCVDFFKDRLEEGSSILVARGSTNAYVLEEMYKHLGIDEPFEKADFISGEILSDPENRLTSNSKARRKMNVLFTGTEAHDIANDAEQLDIVRHMKGGDLVVKGGNALDSDGNVGILVGDQYTGGTIGTLYGIIRSKGLELVIPIGLEKAIFGDLDANSMVLGASFCKYSMGMPVGLFPVTGTVITEIDAVEMLFDVEAFHVASGGIGDAQGSVVLAIESENDEALADCEKFLETEILGEPRLEPNPVE
jgi:hypothetical protein